MQKEQLVILLQGHFNATLSTEERELLAAFINEPGNKALVIEALAQTGMALPAAEYNSHRFDPLLQNILAADRQAPVRKIFPWKRIAVAASILITIGIAAYVISTRNEEKSQTPTVATTHDVPAPDKNRAQIKLSDGTIVYLDSAANGELVNANGVTVTKTADGKIIYTPSAVATPTAVEYNTLMNPRGSKVQPLTLSDGTKLWLNAESSITYPTVFTGNERRVTITGEAYFEVAPNKSKPFIVSANNKADVTVLGTHFNVNAYTDEKDIKVTLVEGSVQVSATTSAKTSALSAVKIKPGEQAVLTNDSRLTTNGSPDIDQVLAWKNNDFIFQDDNLQDIMRQLARWYNINPIFTATATQSNTTNYTGRITRTVPISEVLAMFEKLGYVKFQINGNRVTVIQQ